MTPAQVIEHYSDGTGNIQRASEHAPVSRQSLQAWKKAGRVPVLWQIYIERDTAGLQVGVLAWPAIVPDEQHGDKNRLCGLSDS